MSRPHKHIMIVAGEASGDMHAAHLVDEIKKLDPSITFSGLGGTKMKESGVELYEDLTRLAVVGFWEIWTHYTDIKRIFNLIVEKVQTTQTKSVILVDYPGFNLLLAKQLKKLNVQVLYYISPQVWAWKKSRVKTIKKYVDKMFVLFKFEKEFYAKFDVDVELVGHPLVDTITLSSSKNEILSSLGFSQEKLTIGILPGSRQKEINTLLPIMLEACQIIYDTHPQAQFMIIKAPTIERTHMEKLSSHVHFPLRIIEEKRYDSINASDLCIVASGTATLETGLLEKPMVVVYKTSFLTWLLAKMFIKIPDIGLVNVVAEKRIVPECIQFQATGKNIAKELMDIYSDKIKIADIKAGLQNLKNLLGEPEASRRAAEKILNHLYL